VIDLSRLDDWCIDNWRKALRFWSTWMITIGGFIGSFMTLIPALPPEVQQAIPVKYRVIVVALWSGASLLTRFIKQPKLNG
jgi:hypothetical protein